MASITGTDTNDNLTGTSDADVINGLAGNDKITGGAGADTLIGGDGDDEFLSGGTDLVAGENIDGGSGTNQISVFGSANLSVISLSNIQTLNIHPAFIPSTPEEFAAYVPPTVTLTAQQFASLNRVWVVTGLATINAANAGTYSFADKTVAGGTGYTFIGSSGNDTFIGNNLKQVIIGGLGADSLTGNDGSDIFTYTALNQSTATQTDIITDFFKGIDKIDLTGLNFRGVTTGTPALGWLKLTYDAALNVTTLEDLGGSGFTVKLNGNHLALDDSDFIGLRSIITGTSGNDYLPGTSDDDQISGLDGNDVLQGLGGADTMLGGNGDDEFLVGFDEAMNDVIDGGAGQNKISSWNANLSQATISNVQTLIANLDRVTLTASQFAGFTNIITYGNNPITIRAATSGNYSFSGKTVSGTFHLTGSNGHDTLAGDSKGQVLDGGDGNDIIQGLGGADTTLGGNGDDEFLVGFDEAIGDVIDGGIGNNKISSWNADLSQTTISNVQTLIANLNRVTLTATQFSMLTNVANFSNSSVTIQAATSGTYSLAGKSITGTFNLVGSMGDDILIGSAAAEKLTGGLGFDMLTGGAGADTFTYLSIADSTAAKADIITDFTKGLDKIDLTGLGFYGLTTGTTQAGQLKISYDAAFNRTTIADLHGTNFSLILNGNHLTISDGDFIGLRSIINGTNGNDYLVGTAQRDVISGLDGNDVLQGGLSADTMLGGAGDDEFLVGGAEIAAGEVIDGGTGNNTISTWGGDLSLATITNVQALAIHLDGITLSNVQLSKFTKIIGYDGPFTIYGKGQSFTFDNHIVSDDYTFVGTEDNNIIYNYVTDSKRASTLKGMGGDDVFLLGDSAETVYGGEGADLYRFQLTSISSDTFDRIVDFEIGIDKIITPTFFTGVSSNAVMGQLQIEYDAASDTTKVYDRFGTNFGFLLSGNKSALSQSDFRSFWRTISFVTGSSAGEVLATNGLNYIAIQAGDGDDTIIDNSSGSNWLFGEGGNDTFEIASFWTLVGVIDGGSGFNTLRAIGNRPSFVPYTDISEVTVSNIQALIVSDLGVKLSSRQFKQMTSITAATGQSTIIADDSDGVYDLRSQNITGTFNLVGNSSVNNTLTGDDNSQTIRGGDFIGGKTGISDTLNGNGGNDQLFGLAGDDILNGGDGNDALQGDLGADRLTGGAGVDIFTYLSALESTATQTDIITDFTRGTDKINLTGLNFSSLSTGLTQAGQLKVSYDAALNRTTIADLHGSNFSLVLNGNHLAINSSDIIGLVNVINGTNGDDYLAGTAQSDIISGFDGNDVLQGGLGADTMLGGDGDDEFLVGGTEIAAGEVIDGGSGYNTISTWGGDLSLATITNVQRLGVHLDHITLSSDQLRSFTKIEGHDGSFTIYGTGLGQFSLYGQVVANNYAFVGTGGDDNIAGSFALANGHAIIKGMGGDDTISLFDYFDAYKNNFSIDGGAGIDTLFIYAYEYPRRGADLSSINISNIEILGGNMLLNAAQIQQYTLRSDSFFTAVTEGTYDFTTAKVFGGAGVHFTNLSNSSITGTSLADTLVSDGINSTLRGGDGADIISTLQGNNSIYGDAGDDIINVAYEAASSSINGGTGYNILRGNGNEYRFVNLTAFSLSNIQAMGGYVLITRQQFENIGSIEEGSGISVSEAGTYDLRSKTTTGNGFSFFGSVGDDLILGSNGIDYIKAGDGNDTVNANGGNDTILCDGTGNDHLNGGDGDDIFEFRDISNAYNQIINGGAGYNTLLSNKYTDATMVVANMQLSNIQEISGTVIINPADALKYEFAHNTTLFASVGGLYDLSTSNDRFIIFYGSAGDDKIIYGDRTDGPINGGAGNDEIHGNDINNYIDAGSGRNTIYGGSGYDSITGGAEKDVIYCYGENDFINGHGGGDDVHGGTGNDTYAGVGMNIYEDDNTAGNTDQLYLGFNSAVSYDQVWFSQSSNDLLIRVIGTTDSVTVKDWYLGNAHHVEQIRSYDGRTLLDTQVQNLVNAMAGFAVPSTTTLSAEYHAALAPVLAANWT